MSILFSPLKVGEITLKNRIIMSPLTRSRSDSTHVPNVLMAEYYAQRASAGLIISEATNISPLSIGYANTPGIWNAAQIAGWKLTTQAVHAQGGKIFLQLWHVGRISDPYFLNGNTPVAPSAIKPAGHVSLLRPERSFVMPRGLKREEVKALVQQFKKAAKNAQQAGFDGVEIHGANGYLIDQFLQSSTNYRSDEYGGSLENRARFLLEITDEVIKVWGAGRVGVHLAPACDSYDMGDANPEETFTYVARELGNRHIAFIFCREGQRENYLTAKMKREFKGVTIANQGLTQVLAESLIDAQKADACAWGKDFITNPDLVMRFKYGLPLVPSDNRPSFYFGGKKGYTDYPRFYG